MANNPKAFPRPYSHDERPSGGHEYDRVETFNTQDGMTLLDYFGKSSHGRDQQMRRRNRS